MSDYRGRMILVRFLLQPGLLVHVVKFYRGIGIWTGVGITNSLIGCTAARGESRSSESWQG